MTTDAELTEKLARLGARVAAKQEGVRQRLEAAGCLALAEACKATFGARLVWFRDRGGEIGTEPERGQPYNFELRPQMPKPERAAAPRPRRKGERR